MNPKCMICDKTVYPVEMVRLDEKILHKLCFRCGQCKCILSAGKYAAISGKYYCKPHFKQLFALKGNYTGGFQQEGDPAPTVVREDSTPKRLSQPPQLQDASSTNPSFLEMKNNLRPTSMIRQSANSTAGQDTQQPAGAAQHEAQESNNHEPSAVQQQQEGGANMVENRQESDAQTTVAKSASGEGFSDDSGNSQRLQQQQNKGSNGALNGEERGGVKAAFKVSDRIASSIENLRNSQENLYSKSESTTNPAVNDSSAGVRINKVADRYPIAQQPQPASNTRVAGAGVRTSMVGSDQKPKYGAVPSSKCTTCDKTVYPVEQINVEAKTFHKNCFRCAHCNNLIKLGNYAALDGKFYCKPHFKQLFALKGNYNGGFGTKEHKEKWTRKDEHEVQAN